MLITFNCKGIAFEAEVAYVPAVPGETFKAPEHCYPDEPAECEILALLAGDDRVDGTFLLDSEFGQEIENAALVAATEQFNAGEEP